MNRAITNRETIGLAAGLSLWALAFVVLYGGHGLACSLGVRAGHGDTATRLLLCGAWVVMLLAHAALIVWFHRRLKRSQQGSLRFVRLVSFVLAVGSLGATIWTGLPVLTLTICN